MPTSAPSQAGTAALIPLPAVVWSALLLCGCALPDLPGPLAQGGPAAAVSTPPGLPCSAADFPQQVLVKLNAYRSAGARCGLSGHYSGSAPLAWSEPLARAAALHSQDLAQRQLLDHRGSDGSSLTQRLDIQGYRWSVAAENVAAGQPDLTQVLAAWMGSPSHCANLLTPIHRDVGLACRRAVDGQVYWTAVVAQPQPAAAPAAPASTAPQAAPRPAVH